MRETAKASAAFEEYCALGTERSLRKLVDKSGTNLAQLGIWSREHSWQERVKRYDAARIEEKRRKTEAETEAMNSRHAQIGVTQQARAIEQIKTLIEAKAFGSMAAVQLLKLATDLERVARGAATEIAHIDHSGDIAHHVDIEGQVVIDVRKLSNAQLNALDEMLASVEEGEGND